MLRHGEIILVNIHLMVSFLVCALSAASAITLTLKKMVLHIYNCEKGLVFSYFVLFLV